MLVQQIVHKAFTSNTYIISNKADDDVWLVDIGNYEGAMEFISDAKTVKGVFITHYHYDHIYGINDLIDKKNNDGKILAALLKYCSNNLVSIFTRTSSKV